MVECWICRRNAMEISKEAEIDLNLINQHWYKFNFEKLGKAFSPVERTEDYYEDISMVMKNTIENVNICIICFFLAKSSGWSLLDSK